jgi:dihydrofolate reductase
MTTVRAHNISVSLDGFMAGPDQGREHPLGVGGEQLHEWIFATRFGRQMIGAEGGTSGVDNDLLVAGEVGIGATIMGRNMFGPIRGDWGDDSWTGWWGDEPPYHHPVFVLTHHPRASVAMSGGTVFHFVTDGIEAALERATEAAGGADIRIGGGASVIRAYLGTGLLDDLHLAVVPVLLGRGERVLDGVDPAGYRAEPVAVTGVVHYRIIGR